MSIKNSCPYMALVLHFWHDLGLVKVDNNRRSQAQGTNHFPVSLAMDRISEFHCGLGWA